MALSIDPCPLCGRTEFEEVNGMLQCYGGHVQVGGQQVAQDDADYMRAGVKRRLKEVREKQKVSKVYRGTKGFELFLKAWQHILWKQCYALIHQHGLPSELWTIVRELWALRLSKLMIRLEDLGEVNLNQLSDASTASESGPDQDEETKLKSFKTAKNAVDNPTLFDTISLNCIGILILQHPTSLATIYTYMREEKLCYIRAIRHVPGAIRDHLASEYHAALDTITIPTQDDLQLAVYRIGTMYGQDFGMTLPSLNLPLMLMDRIQNLALPLEVFPAVKHLAGMLGYEFRYPQNNDKRRNATTYPEAQLMALIIVATKLLYPFESDIVMTDHTRAKDLTAMQMDWQDWMSVRHQKEGTKSHNGVTPRRAIEIADTNILQMSVDQLDQYMDWFQRTYTKEIKADQQHKEILNMFPLKDIPDDVLDDGFSGESKAEIMAEVRSVQAGPRYTREIDEVEEPSSIAAVTRPGQQYQQYRSVNDMSDAAAAFHNKAAELSCLNVGALLKACLRTERLLLLLQHERRRNELFDADTAVQSD